ncbi:MAG: GAP family protein [Mycobacterium sp.]|nr:GAP family protein [Mycobacterium sp.]
MSNVSSDLTELIPLALIIAVSPLSIIPGILVLGTPRPRPTSIAFLLGWFLGIAVITAAFVGGSDLSSGGLDNKPSWAPYVRIVLGAALIVFGIYRWLGRHRSAHQPKWMAAMSSMGPRRAFLTAIALTVANLKVFAMCAAAGVAIGTAALGRPGAAQAVLIFTALSASTVAIPALGYLVAGERLDAPLGRVKDWMERNHSALVAGILLVIGAALIYKGIHAL